MVSAAGVRRAGAKPMNTGRLLRNLARKRSSPGVRKPARSAKRRRGGGAKPVRKAKLGRAQREAGRRRRARFGREGRSFGGGAAGASHFWRKWQSFRGGLKASQTAHPDLLPQQAFWHLPPPIRGMDAAHQVSAQRGIASCAPASI